MKQQNLIKTTTAIITVMLIVIATNTASAQQFSADEANMQTVSRLMTDYFVAGDSATIESLLSADFVAHDPLNGEMNREAFISFYNGRQSEMREYELLAGQGMVAQMYADAQEAPVLLMPEHFDFGPNGMYDSMVNFFYVENDQIVEAWVIYDRISLRDFTGVSASMPAELGGSPAFAAG